MKNRSFVIDTNILISAFIFSLSTPRQAFEKAARNGSVCASFETYDEFRHVLFRSKFDKYISPSDKILALSQFKELVIFFEPTDKITICRDPKDNKFLELAVAAKASCVITGDQDLLVLHPFRGIPIFNANDFLSVF